MQSPLNNIYNFLSGVDKFYSNFQRKEPSDNVIWQEGSTNILGYGSLESTKPILVLIPSLINKSYIFDLSEESSLVNYFVNLGYRVLLVNFNEPLADESNMGLLDYIERLERGINITCKNDVIVTIGYCLGGLFSSILNSEEKINCNGQVLIATPWDFSHFYHILGINNLLIFQNLKMIVENLDKVSPALVQWFFSFIDPNKIWNKFSEFSKMQDDQDINKFLNVERWINDGISLTNKFAVECLDIIHSNTIPKRYLSEINHNLPCLIINGLEDKIVPPISSSNFINLYPNNETLIRNTGHIGLIVSKVAKQEIWPSIANWIISH